MLENLKCLVLDFDGVIVESNHIKDDAFRKILGRYPDLFDELWAYHISNNTIDRHGKFSHFVTRILGYRDDELVNKLSSEFSNLTQQAIISCPMVPGALEFLQYFKDKIPLHLASATPETNLLDILKARQLKDFFTSISGSERTKSEVIFNIMRSFGISADNILFVGDSPEDFETARATQVHFMPRRSDRYDAGKMPEASADLFEISAKLEKMNVLSR